MDDFDYSYDPTEGLDDYNVWEENQVFLDREGKDEEDEDLPADEEEKDYLAGSHGSDYDRPEPQF